MTQYTFTGPKYAAAIIERFPDGTQTKHYYETKEAAEFYMANGNKRPGRTYEMVGVS